MHSPALGDFQMPASGPAEPGGWNTWPPAAKVATGCGAGCALVTVLGALAAWGMMAMFVTLRPPAGLTATVQAPKEAVTVGKPFPLTVTLRNGGGTPVNVTNVTVRSTTLSEVSLENPQPPPPPSFTVPIAGTRFWSYQQTIAPGGTWSVRFDATARKAGTLEGTIEVQVPVAVLPAKFKVKAK